MATPSREAVRSATHRRFPLWLVSLAVAGSVSAQATTTQVQSDASATQPTTAVATATKPATTLAAAWAKALEANPGLQAAKSGFAASEGAVQQSKALPNPELAFTQEDTRAQTRSSTVQINQLVELGGKREARMEMAKSEKATAHAAVFETQSELRYQLVTYFNELLLAQKKVQFASQTHALATQAADAANKRVQAGKVPPLEASRAQVAQANAALELQQAQSNIVVAQQNLASLWGGMAAEVGEASGDFTAIAESPTAEELDLLLQNAPAMLLARGALEQSRAASDLEKAKRVQDPTVSLGVKRANEVGRNQIILGVSIPLPLFDRNAGNQLQALRKMDQAESKLEQQRLQLQTQVFTARQQLFSSQQQSALLKSQVVPTAQSAYDVAVRGFSLGKFNFLDVLDAQRTLVESQRQLLDQLMTSHRARAEMDRLLGTASKETPSALPAYSGI